MKQFESLFGRPRRFLAAFAVMTAFGALSCAKQVSSTGGGGGSTPATGATTTATGAGGSGSTSTGTSLCAMDCGKIQTPPCLKAVCNDGSFVGTVGACVVVDDDGAPCDDNKFCTTNDKCMGGVCVGGPPNTCGMMPIACNKIECSEATKTCAPAPDATQDGTNCTSTDKCMTGSICMAGACTGTPTDCSFDPNGECNTVACDPSSGMCKITAPDLSKNGKACSLTGDLCKNGKTCMTGACTGGTPTDCSSLTHDCVVGQCVASNGMCMAMPIPAGGMCAAATDQCNQGICNAAGVCSPMPLPTGTACNDHNACTSGDSCNAGVCSGTSVTGCTVYYSESFETCPAGWTLAGDWKCGVPTVGPPAAENGTKVLGNGMTASYVNNDSYATDIATSPSINLTSATSPELVFYMWVDTEGNTYDGANLKISTDNGATWSLLTTSKPYTLTIASEQAWGGHESNATGANLGWQRVTANLQPYIGHNVLLRYAFRSDGSGTYPGVYIDDMTVAEANAIPLTITTTSIPNAYVGQAYSANLARQGGSPSAVWSIVPAGSTNYSWLTINPMTGALSGTPTAANAGAGSVHVHVQEPSLPSNFADKTFNFTVGTAIYFQSFEGACPNGWTLAGDWQCGSPTPLPSGSGTAPATAYSGSKCIATGLGTGYTNNLAWASNTATSPAIVLTGASPKLDFVAYLESEVGFDGFNLQVSTDGGVTYNVVTGVMPAYTGTIGTPSESAWEAAPATGWQPYHADLTPYANQTIRLRFAFRSDGSNTYAGAYIDDVVVH